MENTTREKLKLTAYKLFEEKSYDSVTIKDICQAASIGKTTFYYHFKSKEELLEDCINQPEPVPLEILNHIITMDSCWEQIWYLAYYVTSKVEEMGHVVYSQVIKANLDENKGTFDILNNKLLSIVLPIMDKAKETGEIHNPVDSKDLINASWVMHTGLYTQWCVQKEAFNLAQKELELLEIVFQVDEKYRFKLEEFKAKYSL